MQNSALPFDQYKKVAQLQAYELWDMSGNSKRFMVVREKPVFI